VSAAEPEAPVSAAEPEAPVSAAEPEPAVIDVESEVPTEVESEVETGAIEAKASGEYEVEAVDAITSAEEPDPLTDSPDEDVEQAVAVQTDKQTD
jgi:hypothetical protein